jgi:putative glycosyltransferase (TIGR04372 family)
MDVFLCANAKFFLGNSSGLFILSTVFGVPCALSNMLPFVCTGFTSRDLSIPKLIRKLSEDRYLNYQEIIRENIANFRNTKQYEISGVMAVSNAEDDIYSLVCEMFDRLDGKLTSDEIMRDNETFLEGLESAHYSYGTSSYVSPSFIRKYLKVFGA